MALKYIDLANRVLRDFGRDGRPGQKLPPASALCRRYRVSYATMHRALQTLADRQLLRRASRRGTVLTAKALTAAPNIMRARRKLRIASAFNARVNAALLELLQKFGARRQNLQVELTEFGQPELETRADVLESADLLFVNEWMVRQYLTDPRYFRAFLPLEELPELEWDPEACAPAAVAACRTSAGRLLALPVNASPVVSCQNLDYSAKAGEFSPDSPLDEFVRRLRRHQSKGAGYRSYPMILSTGMNRWPIFVRMFGGELFSADGRRCLLDQSAAIRAIEFLADLGHVKHLCCLPLSLKANLGDLFDYGHFLTTWVTRSFLHARQKFKLGFAPLPHGARRTTHLRLDACMIPRAVEQPALVRDWLNFLLLPENQLFLSERADAFACHRKIGEMFCRGMAQKIPGFDVFLNELEHAEPVVAAPRISVVEHVYSRIQLVWLGVEPPAQACRRIAAEANRMLAAGNHLNLEFEKGE